MGILAVDVQLDVCDLAGAEGWGEYDAAASVDTYVEKVYTALVDNFTEAAVTV